MKENDVPPSDFGWNLNQTLNQLIGFYDAKAAALIAADVVIFTLLLANKPTFSSHSVVLFKPLAEALVVAFPFTYGLGLLSLAVSTGFAAYAFCPPTFREHEKNVVFWKWIKTLKPQDYQAQVRDLNSSSLNEYYAEENCRLSNEVGRRILWIRLSVYCLMVGLFFALASNGLLSYLVKAPM